MTLSLPWCVQYRLCCSRRVQPVAHPCTPQGPQNRYKEPTHT